MADALDHPYLPVHFWLADGYVDGCRICGQSEAVHPPLAMVAKTMTAAEFRKKFTPMQPHEIERFKIDSHVIASAGYEDGVLVLEMKNGHLYAYDLPAHVFEQFAQAESKGNFYGREIKGKFTARKLTGKCPQCGSEPEIIDVTCSDCGVGVARAIDRTHKE